MLSHPLHTASGACYLVSDVGNVSGELSIRGELSHMLHKVLDHLQMTLHVVTKERVSTLHSNTVCTSYTLLTLLNAIMRLEIFLLSWLSTSAPYCTSRRTTSRWPPTGYNVSSGQARFRQYVCVCGIICYTIQRSHRNCTQNVLYWYKHSECIVWNTSTHRVHEVLEECESMVIGFKAQKNKQV